MKPETAAKMRYVGVRADAPLREITALAEMLSHELGRINERRMLDMREYVRWIHSSKRRAEAALWLIFYLAIESDTDPKTINHLRAEIARLLPRSTPLPHMFLVPESRSTQPLW